jgi:hypothetical protein
MTLEDVPDARRRQVDAQGEQLTVDPAISPRGVLPGQADHQLHRSCGDLRSIWRLRVGPFATDQLTMPAKQGVGLDKQRVELRSGNQSAEASEECSIRGSQNRTGHLSSEKCHLVPEHDDFDGQIGVVRPVQAKDLRGPEESKIKEREGHEPFSRSDPLRRKP